VFLDYYGLKEQPFGVTPNPRFFFSSSSHREALASLICGVECQVGFAALISEPGMGKTTLLFDLLERYRSSADTVFVFNTQCTAHELLREIVHDLRIKTAGEDPIRMRSDLKLFLIDRSRSRPVLLLIDEAQNLEDCVLEAVRLLSDFETTDRKLLHIILAGQPLLAEKLRQPRLAQLMQRITIVSRLERLQPDETGEYIRHRLTVAGYRGPDLFSPEALAKVREHSDGIPRSINRICFNALLAATAAREKPICGSTIDDVVRDLDLHFAPSRGDVWRPSRVPSKRKYLTLACAGLGAVPARERSTAQSPAACLPISSRKALELAQAPIPAAVGPRADSAPTAKVRGSASARIRYRTYFCPQCP
jgi:general secretion pathway protein A